MDFENRNTNEETEGRTFPEQGTQQQDNSASGTAQQRQDPFEQRVNTDTPPYTTYQEWVETERKRTAKQ